MKPEEPVSSVVSTTPSDSNTNAPQPVLQHKGASSFSRKRQTPESMRLLKKSKAASHRRQIRRSHANG